MGFVWRSRRGVGGTGSGEETDRRSSSLPTFYKVNHPSLWGVKYANASFVNRFALGMVLVCCCVIVLSFRMFQLEVSNTIRGDPPAFNYDGQASEATNLVIVAGHAVLNFAADFKSAAISDESWHLLDYHVSELRTGVLF